MPRTTDVPDRVLAALQAVPRPLGLRRKEIRERLGLPMRTVDRALKRLLDDELIEKTSHGVYLACGEDDEVLPALAGDSSQRIWQHLRDRQVPAYLTALDVLAAGRSDLPGDFAHVVVCHPSHAGRLLMDLATEQRFIAIKSDDGQVAAPVLDQVVFVRELSTWQRYGVRNFMAPVELAWVDLYREVRRARVALAPEQLGSLLAELLASGAATERRLRQLAHDFYRAELAGILDGSSSDGIPARVAEGLHDK